MIRGLWKVLRGTVLLAVLGCIFTAVLLVSCLASLIAGGDTSGRAGRMQTGT